MGLCFVGVSVLDKITEARQKNRHTATLTIMGLIEVQKSDDFKATKKTRVTSS